MKILIEDNGTEVELEIQEYIHLANTVHELGDSDDAISQRGVTEALKVDKLKKVILLINLDEPEEFTLTQEFNAYTVVSEIDLVLDCNLEIGTFFNITTNSSIKLPENEELYTSLGVDEDLTGNIKLTKITDELWIST